MQGVNDKVYSKEVIEFTAVSNEYCRFLDETSADGLKILRILQKLLPLLYLKALSLPEAESCFEERLERFVQQDDWQRIHDRLINKFGEANDFLDISDDDHSTEELESCSIAENLSDIYQDNMDFLMAYRVGTDEVMYEAIAECNESFRLHWGKKITSTIRAVHIALMNEGDIGSHQEQSMDEKDTSEWFISRRQDDLRKDSDEI